MLKAVKAMWKSKYSHLGFLEHSEDHLTDLALKESSKPIPVNGQNGVMEYYLASHDFGYVFVFVNNSDTLTLDEYITFPIFNNLELTPEDNKASNGSIYWKFIVKPQSKMTKILRKAELTKGFNISYKTNHVFLNPGQSARSIEELTCPETLSDNQLSSILQERGIIKPCNSKSKGYTGWSYCYVSFGSFYAWKFINDHKINQFRGIYTFKLTNMRLENPDKNDRNVWSFELAPRKSIIKKMFVVDKKLPSTWSLSFIF